MVIAAQRKLYFKQDDEPPRSKHSALKFWGEIKKDAYFLLLPQKSKNQHH